MDDWCWLGFSHLHWLPFGNRISPRSAGAQWGILGASYTDTGVGSTFASGRITQYIWTLREDYCNAECHSETHLKPNSREISFAKNSFAQSFGNFVYYTVVILSCSAQSFKMIWQLKWMFWTNEVFRDLSLRCKSPQDGNHDMTPAAYKENNGFMKSRLLWTVAGAAIYRINSESHKICTNFMYFVLFITIKLI